MSRVLGVYEPVLFYFQVEVFDELFVDAALCSCIVVELYLEVFEKMHDQLMVLVGQLARRNAEFDGLHFDGSAMFVASTDHDDVFAFQSEIARVDIGREKLGKCTKMGTVVDVWPSGANDPSSQFLHPSRKKCASSGLGWIRVLQNRFLETVEIPGRTYST